MQGFVARICAMDWLPARWIEATCEVIEAKGEGRSRGWNMVDRLAKRL